MACKKENESLNEDCLGYSVSPFLPTDAEISSAFVERSKREGTIRGMGIRLSHSAQGSDSWVDDPITRHIVSICVEKEDGEETFLLWPLILHIKGQYYILVLPLVEPQHLKAYERMCRKSDCGDMVGVDETLSSLLVDLPCITGYGHLWLHMLLVM